MDRYADTLVQKVTWLLISPLYEQEALIIVVLSAAQEMGANVLQFPYFTD